MKAGQKAFVRDWPTSETVTPCVVISGPHFVGGTTFNKGQESYIVECQYRTKMYDKMGNTVPGKSETVFRLVSKELLFTK